MADNTWGQMPMANTMIENVERFPCGQGEIRLTRTYCNPTGSYSAAGPQLIEQALCYVVGDSTYNAANMTTLINLLRQFGYHIHDIANNDLIRMSQMFILYYNLDALIHKGWLFAKYLGFSSDLVANLSPQIIDDQLIINTIRSEPASRVIKYSISLLDGHIDKMSETLYPFCAETKV